jgi:two-component system, LytTR family, response regulator LytT
MQQAFRIIIIEDEALIAESLHIMLENDGFDIAAKFYSYNEAKENLHNIDFDLAMVDINLSDSKTGIDIAKDLLQPLGKPFIYLTAYDDKDTIAQAIQTAPSNYLIKPANSSVLFASIQLALQNYSHKEQNEESLHQEQDYFFIKLGKQNIKIFWKDIEYISHEKNYIHICGQQLPTNGCYIRASLHHVFTNLIPQQFKNSFIQINRKTIVNKNCITKTTNDEIYIREISFDIGVTFSTEVKKEITNRKL